MTTKVAIDMLSAGARVPAGAVLPFAMNSVSSGWLACDGAAHSRTAYADLFAAIGVVYGAGDGSTTFNVPDLRGLFIRGLGTTGTHAAAALGTLQEDQFEAHTHSQYTNSGAGSGPVVGGGAFGALNATTGSTGGAETAPANYAMLYCIKT